MHIRISLNIWSDMKDHVTSTCLNDVSSADNLHVIGLKERAFRCSLKIALGRAVVPVSVTKHSPSLIKIDDEFLTRIKHRLTEVRVISSRK